MCLFNTFFSSSLSVKCTGDPFNSWTAVTQEALTNCFYSGELLCLLCFAQSTIMHLKYSQEKPNGTHYTEETHSLNGFRRDTSAEPLRPVRASPKCVVLSSMRKCRSSHTIDPTVIASVTKINRLAVVNSRYTNYGRFHFYLWHSQGKQSLCWCIGVVSVVEIISDSSISTLTPFTIVFYRNKY